MKKYLIIIKVNNFKIPFIVKANNRSEIFKIAAEYFEKEGYFPESVEVVELYSEIANIN